MGKIIAVLLVLAIIFCVIYYAPLITSYSQNPLTTIHDYLFGRSYTEINVFVGQEEDAKYQQGNNTWYFVYHGNQFAVFTASTQFQPEVFPATLGATYTYLGLDIKVSEVHLDHIVLLVKTTH
jgi:hypothetical protein